MTVKSTHQILPQDGALYDSSAPQQNYFTKVPNGANNGLDLVKNPSATSWAVFSAMSGGAGYVSAIFGSATATSAGTKVVIPLLGMPDGQT